MSGTSSFAQQHPALEAAVRADPFAAYLGATLEEVRPGYARMKLVVRPEFTGPQGVTHGGALFTLAEAALAAAMHAHNRVHLALNVNITFHVATYPGDTLTAEAHELRAGGRISSYTITVNNGDGTLVATSQAVVYRTSTALVEEEA